LGSDRSVATVTVTARPMALLRVEATVAKISGTARTVLVIDAFVLARVAIKPVKWAPTAANLPRRRTPAVRTAVRVNPAVAVARAAIRTERDGEEWALPAVAHETRAALVIGEACIVRTGGAGRRILCTASLGAAVTAVGIACAIGGICRAGAVAGGSIV